MLTSSQASTLKTAIQGDSSVAAFVAAADWPSVAANYNGASSPAVAIWIPDFSSDVLMSSISMTDWDALTTGQQLAVVGMLSRGYVDATQSGIQAWFTNLFTGKTSLSNLAAAAKRTATKFENLFVTNGVSSVFGYVLSADDVQQAMGA